MAIMKKLLILLLFIPYLGFSQIKISALTEATRLNANDWFMAVQGGTTKKVAFYRFSYNQDSTALQITDSLAFYVQKTELSDSLLNYILRTELNDSLANYTSLDSLTYYMKTIDVRNAISDSIAGISSVSLGIANQVAFVNSTGTDLAYSDNFKWNDTTLTLNFGTRNIFITSNSSGLTTGADNVFLGYEAGKLNTSGYQNVFIGGFVGDENTTGYYNTFIGTGSGTKTTTGNKNTYIGYQTGVNNLTGTKNIFIGYQAGYSYTGSNKLFIDSDNTSFPLIWGDFANDSVRINGTLDVTENLTVDTITTYHLYPLTKSHGFFAFEDSSVVINCIQDTWVQVTNATNTLFAAVQTNEGFIISGDTITFNADARDDLHPHILIHWGIDGFAANGEDYEIRMYNIDNTAGIVRKAEGTTTGANNRVSIGTTSYDNNSAFGDRYILQIMNKTNSNDFTIENGSIYIEVSHY